VEKVGCRHGFGEPVQIVAEQIANMMGGNVVSPMAAGAVHLISPLNEQPRHFPADEAARAGQEDSLHGSPAAAASKSG
jgi:hypothetical protein